MGTRYKPLPPDHVKQEAQYPKLKAAYLVKKTYYVFSFIFFFLTLMALPMFIYLNQTGELPRENPYWAYFLYFIAALAVVAMGFRLRCSFCAVCNTFTWPTNLDYNSYCSHCGAHLFDFDAYESQEVERSKFEMSIEERFLEMARRGDTEALRTLLEKGAVLDHKDKYGYTALMRAAMENRVGAVDFLVGMGANIYYKNNFGLNALMLAVDQHRHESVRALLRYDFDLEDTTNDGRTVRDIAVRGKDETIISMLEKA